LSKTLRSQIFIVEAKVVKNLQVYLTKTSGEINKNLLLNVPVKNLFESWTTQMINFINKTKVNLNHVHFGSTNVTEKCAEIDNLYAFDTLPSNESNAFFKQFLKLAKLLGKR
jgi:pyruvate formate-lyase activating enzyme-like uncharacterized protein